MGISRWTARSPTRGGGAEDASVRATPQQRLNFRPLPQGHGSFLPGVMFGNSNASPAARLPPGSAHTGCYPSRGEAALLFYFSGSRGDAWGLPARSPHSDRSLLAAWAGPARAGREDLRGEASGRGRAVARHGIAGGLRPYPLREGEPAGGRVVRRAQHRLRPRRARRPPGAVPAVLGGGDPAGEPAGAGPLLRRLQDSRRPRLQLGRRRRGRRAARLGRPARSPLEGEDPDPLPDRLRHDAGDLRDDPRAVARARRARPTAASSGSCAWTPRRRNTS